MRNSPQSDSTSRTSATSPDASFFTGPRLLTGKQWRDVSKALDAALKLPPAEQDAFVQQFADEAFRTEVGRLLQAFAEAARTPEQPDDASIDTAAEIAALRTALEGQYMIVREMGVGGMATIYLALDERHHRPVAIKVMHAGLQIAHAVDRFLREIAIAAALRHPHIVPLFDSGRAGPHLYYVMPVVGGESLRARVRREGHLPLRTTLAIIRDVADALDYAHAHGVVHRDIKPENILLEGSHACVTDFGIARAVHAVGGYWRTDTGIAIGTHTYMSPEQEAGLAVDGRADIYSLAVVTYEMLLGERQLPRHVRQIDGERSLTGPRLKTSVERALRAGIATNADDRYATAREFVDALERAAGKPSRVMMGSLGMVVALSGLVLLRELPGLGDPGTTTVSDGDVATTSAEPRIVLLPHGASDSDIGRSVHDDMLHQAFSRWRGITLVDQFQTADAVRRRGGVTSMGDAEAIAKSLGANQYVRAQITRAGDSIKVYAALFAVGSRQALHQRTVQLSGDLSAATAGYAALADSLLLRGANTGMAPGRELESQSLPAVQAVVRAQRALDEWSLAEADSEFQTAIGHDPEFARANLWLAQVRAWRGIASAEWATVAERAAMSSALPDRERKLAEALRHLAKERYREACALYDELRRENDRDFAAWFGLGQCRTMDTRVVRDAASPSGYRFRGGSYHRAMEAYARAFEILPSVHRGYERGAFEQLRVLLLLSNAIVEGYGEDNTRFHGRPAWMGDTLALIPYPWQLVSSGDPRARPPGIDEAIARQKAMFARIAIGWSAAYPQSAAAKHAVALALDSQNDPAALDTLHAARQLARRSERALQLATAHVLMLAKYGLGQDLSRTRYAGLLADSLLRQPGDSSPAASRALLPLAALTGRCGAADSLARHAAGDETIPGIVPHLHVLSHGITAQAALGCTSAERVRELAAAIHRAYGASGRDTLSRVYDMVLFRPAVLLPQPDSAALAPLASFSHNRLVHAAFAASRGDLRAAREELVRWSATPAPTTPDMAFASAAVWARAGDTAAAIARLDRVLAGLPTYEPHMLRDHVRVGALMRALMLRAELAMAQGDRDVARRWSIPVSLLWSSADATLRPQVARMEVLARLN